MTKKLFVLFGVLATMFGLSYSRAFDIFAAQGVGYNDLSASDTMQLMKTEKDLLILDVRTQQEFTGEMGHLKGAKLIPVDELSSRLGEIASHKKKKVLVYCRSGVRSRKASSILVNAGFENVNNVTPGMMGMSQVPGVAVER